MERREHRERQIVTRKTTLAMLDDDFDIRFWSSIPPVDRLIECWRLSEEIWRFAGRDVDESGLPRSVARVVRR
jgi:hypothetical protein